MKTTIYLFSSLHSCFYSKLLLRVGTRMMIVNPRVIAVLVSIVSVDFVLVVNKGEGKAGGDVRTSPPL
jgi:hypothetical protein